jgi:hypothetical protein
MKRLPLLSLSLVATLGVGCSNPSQEDAPAPTQQVQVKKRTQALSSGRVTLEEVPVSAAVLAAAEGHATVRTFRIVASEAGVSVGEIAAAAHLAGASDPANLPWELGPERGQEETREALKYLSALVPAIEAEVGTGEVYSSGYEHWFQMSGQDFCNHGDFYSLVFKEAGLVFVIEASGGAEC